mgnify:CR=1 FL=1
MRFAPYNTTVADFQAQVAFLKSRGKIVGGYVNMAFQKSEAELMDIRNFGQKSIDEVKAKLEELGLGLREE